MADNISNDIIESIPLDLQEQSYDILVGTGLLKSVGSWLKSKAPHSKIYIVTDENVGPLYGKTVIDSCLRSGLKAELILLPAGESTKCWGQLETLIDNLLTLQLERRDAIVALGGGVTGDIAGFAAATILRGVKYFQVPSSLLAQVDSSVGGKTGINTPKGKNLVGAFYQPSGVMIDLALLSTLNDREYRAGLAEIVKYGLGLKGDFFGWLESNSQALMDKKHSALAYSIAQSCKEKARIVAKDEKEGSVRKLLNLGHTFAHALEAESQYNNELLHGEAVAVGMVMAASLSEQLGHCKQGLSQRLIVLLNKLRLPTHITDLHGAYSVQTLINRMRHDKKVTGGLTEFILLNDVGRAFTTHEVPLEILTKIVENSTRAKK